jgi:hypothetical protein
MTIVPAIALRSAERCPVNLAPTASRRPMALPTRVDAAIPAWRRFKGVVVGREDQERCAPKGQLRHEARYRKEEVCRTDAERNGIQDF